MKMNEPMKKVLSFLLAFSLVLGYVPVPAHAHEHVSEGLCQHHVEHTADCGYVEAEALCAYAVDGCAECALSAVAEDPEETTEVPSTEAVEPSAEATEPSEEVTEPSTEATEPSTEATELSTEATEPSVEVTQPEEIRVEEFVDTEEAVGAAATTYIASIAVAYGAKENTPKDILRNQGYTIIDRDLNAGCGSTSHYIYMGYKTTTDYTKAITGIFIRDGKNPPNSATFDGVTAYLLGGSGEANPGENTAVDLNADAGGAYLYTYVTRDPGRSPITEITFSGSSSKSGYTTPNVELNKGAGGDTIYLHYKQFSATVTATYWYMDENGNRQKYEMSKVITAPNQTVELDKTDFASSFNYNGKKFVSYALYGLDRVWREDDKALRESSGTTSVSLATSGKVMRQVYVTDNVIIYNQDLAIQGFEGPIGLTYDTNGGTGTFARQNAHQFLNAGANSVVLGDAEFTLHSHKPTYAGKCAFLGWSTNKNATTASYQPGETIGVKDTTVLYAVWKDHNNIKTDFAYKNETQHTYKRGCCGETVTENHTGTGDSICDLCGNSTDVPSQTGGVYQITNKAELIWFMQHVNRGNKGANAKVMNNIDLGGYNWTPIAQTGLYYKTTTYNSPDAGYTGTFDGNGKVISNFKITASTTVEQTYGLFGTVSGTVKNLGLTGVSYSFPSGTKDLRAGGIVGQMLPGSRVENSYVTNSTITPGQYIVGGIAACNYGGTIDSCYTYKVATSGHERCGNLVSDTRGDINTSDRPGIVTNCYTDGARVAGTQTGSKVTGSEASVSDARFASGEITHKLGAAWGQSIGTGALPVLGGAKVYEVKKCNGDTTWSNDSTNPQDHVYVNNICSLCGLTDPDAAVEVIMNGKVVSAHNNLNDAIQAVKSATEADEAVVKLLQNIDLGDGYQAISSGVFTLDLNGCTLSNSSANYGGLYISGSTALTIEDSGETGAITGQYCGVYKINGTVSISSGTFTGSSYGVYNYQGPFSISGGTIDGGEYGVYNNTGTLSISGGTIDGGDYGVRNKTGTVSISGGAITGGDFGVLIDNGTASISGGTITSNSVGVEVNNGTATITGGTITGDQYDLSVQIGILTLTLGENGTGVTFPGGLVVHKTTLKAVLGEGAAYWQGGKQLAITEDQTGITGGDVVIKAECTHEQGEKNYVNNGEDHTYTWSCCNMTDAESHTFVGLECVCGALIHICQYTNGFCEDGCYEPAACNTEGFYEIHNGGNLFWFAQYANDGSVEGSNEAKALLTADIDLEDREWTPIGERAHPFAGIIDGVGHTVSGLYISTGARYNALIGNMEGGGVKNLTVSGSIDVVCGDREDSEDIYTGLLVGYAAHSGIFDCHTLGTVTVEARNDSDGNSCIGGMAGWIDHCAVINCSAQTDVTVTVSSAKTNVGGLVGSATVGEESTCLLNSYATGTVTAKASSDFNPGTTYVGGIAGYLRDDAVNNYFAGTVSAFDGAYAGSVFGRTMKTTYINSNKVTLTITNNYTANSTAVGYGGEDGMITQIRPDQITGTGKDSLLARLNSNVDGVNNMIANHKTGLLESEWAEITESIGGVAFRAFHWTAGSHGPVQCLGTLTDCACSTCNQILHDWSNGDGICAVCGTVGCLHEQYVNGFCTGCDSYQSATGSGTQDDPYQIGNAGQLYWFAAVVNEGYGRTAKNTSAYGVLTADIDLNPGYSFHSDGTVSKNGQTVAEGWRNWTPMGDLSGNGYGGTFNGQNHCVRGIYINNVSQANIGFFGMTEETAKVLNLGITNSYIRGDWTGGIVGNNDATIEGCYSEATVVGLSRAGGIVGVTALDSAVRNCYNTGSVSGNHSVGGIIGAQNYGRTDNCFNMGTVTGGEGAVVDAIIGSYNSSNGSFSNCYYLIGSAETGRGEGMTAEQFASGELAYLLQQGFILYGEVYSGEIWGQTLGTDTYPVLNGPKVYQVVNCKNEIVRYSNTNESIGHDWSKEDGICVVCGADSSDAVAQVTLGETVSYHATLDAAIQAVSTATAADEAVVKLLQDIDLGETFVEIYSGVFSLDLNDRELKGSGDKVLSINSSSVKLTIADTGTDATKGAITGTKGIDASGGTVTIAGGHVSGTVYGIYCYKAVVYITGGHVSGDDCAVYDLRDGVLRVTGGSISGGNYDIYTEFQPLFMAELTLADGKTEGATFPGGINVDGITLKNILGDGAAYWQDGKQMTITEDQTKIADADVVIKAECTHEQGEKNYVNNGENHTYTYSCCNLTVTESHTFDAVTQLCLCGQLNPATVAQVSKNGAVVSGYTTLGEAFQAVSTATAADEAVVKLLQDIDLGKGYHTISAGVFTLDLNGFVITSTDMSGPLDTNSSAVNLTITDSGETGAISAPDSYYGICVTYGTVTINDGSIIAINGIGNTGTVIMNGGSVSGTNGVMNTGTIIINGGTISGKTSGIFHGYSDTAASIITGGTITGGDYDIDSMYGTVTLALAEGKTEGATFPGGINIYGTTLDVIRGEGAAYWQDGKQITVSESQTEITGGDVTIQKACDHSGHTGSYVITDNNHLYNCTVCSSSITEPHAFDETTLLCICGKDAVAQVRKNGAVVSAYATLNTAIQAVSTATAADEAVVKLLKNVDLGDGSLLITSGIFAIDLNGKTISSNAHAISTGGSGYALTITDSSDNPGTVRAGDTGFSIWLSGGEVTIEKGNFVGRIYLNGGSLVLEDGYIEERASEALYNNGGHLEIKGGRLKVDDFLAWIRSDSGTVIVSGSPVFEGSGRVTFRLGGGALDLSGMTDPTGLTLWNESQSDIAASDIPLPADMFFLVNGQMENLLLRDRTYTIGKDVTAPRVGSPAATRVSAEAATVSFNVDESGEYYYVVTEAEAASPEVDTTVSGISFAAGNITVDVTGLESETGKMFYIWLKDALGNITSTSVAIPAYSEAPAPDVPGTDDPAYSDVPENGWPIWVAGTVVTEDNCTDVLGDGTVSYDSEQNILSLNNADLGTAEFDGIYSEISLTIHLSGENTVESAYGGIRFVGVYEDDLTAAITGTGSLDIRSGNNSLDMAVSGYGTLSIQDNVSISMNADNDEGIYMEGETAEVLIKDNAKLNIGTAAEPISEEAIDVNALYESSVHLTDKAKITIVTDDEEGIVVYSESGDETLTISGDAVVDIVADEEALDADIITITGGTLNLTGGVNFEGIYAADLTITGGSILVDTAGGTQGDGVEADTITITGGCLKILKGGLIASTGENPGTIHLGEGIVIQEPAGGKLGQYDLSEAEEGQVLAVLDVGGNFADALVITDGETAAPRVAEIYLGGIGMASGEYLAVNATEVSGEKPAEGGYAYYEEGVLILHNYGYTGYGVKTTDDYVAALYAPNGVEILLEGENSLIPIAEETDFYTLGIHALADLTITGEGSLTFLNADQELFFDCAVYAADDMTVESGILDAAGRDYGLYVDYNLTIAGGGLTAAGEYTGIYLEYGDAEITGGRLEVTDGGMYTYEGCITLGEGIEVTEPDGGYASDCVYDAAGEYADAFVITGKKPYTGWFTDDNGTTYLIEDEIVYKNTVAHIDDDAYLFDENGYIVAGAGLYRHVTEEGTVEYYYFCDAVGCEKGCTEASYTGFKKGIHWLYKNNDMLPQWDYSFDERGVILHRDDTSLQGLHDEGEETYYFIDGVPAYMGLIEIDGNIYYVRSSGKLIKNQSYWISKTNGLREEGAYTFDAEGKLVEEQNLKNGIIAENDGLYYYVDGSLNYAGLIRIGDSYYYVRTSGKLAQNQRYWITKHNDLLKEGSYQFDADGKLVLTEGIVSENGLLYYYKDGMRNYAGLIEMDGYYYYVNSSGQVITGRDYWISKTNGLMPEHSYHFDSQGRMTNPIILKPDPDGKVKDGIVNENGTLYYYVEGQLTYAGLIQIDGSYYYVNSQCQVITGRKYWITKTNNLLPEASYQFDANGVLQR